MVNEPQDSTSFTVTGGVGSASYTVSEIADTATRIARLAEQMSPLIDRMGTEHAWLADAALSAPFYPYDATHALQSAVWHGQSLRVDTAALAQQASQAAANYEAAEAAAANRMATVRQAKALNHGLLLWALGPMMPLALVSDLHRLLKNSREKGLRDTAEVMINDTPAYLAGLFGPGTAAAFMLAFGGTKDAAAAGSKAPVVLRGLMDAAGLLRPGHIEVRQVPVHEWSPPRNAAQAVREDGGQSGELTVDLAGAMLATNEAYGLPGGSISVEKVERYDGTAVWAVHLPGTEVWSKLDSSNIFDMEGNLEGLTSEQRAAFAQQDVLVQELIKEALRQSGYKAGEEVLLTGHSGGGIHVAAAAADPEFLAEVNVKIVLVAGAPIRHADIGDDVDVFELSSVDDIVAAADAGQRPESKNWVSVTTRRPPMPEGASAVDIAGQAHDMGNYLEDARMLDASGDPAIEGVRDKLAVFFGAGIAGATVKTTKWAYQGSDINDPRPEKQGPSPAEIAKGHEKLKHSGMHYTPTQAQ